MLAPTVILLVAALQFTTFDWAVARALACVESASQAIRITKKAVSHLAVL